ncbi:MAG: hypothetical protein AAGA30_01385 [Planctomycetota bacterium]
MAFIDYVAQDEIPEEFRVPDNDHIIQVHGVHPKIMKLHFDLYVEAMHKSSPLSRLQREMIGVTVSALNGCEY